MVSTLPLSPEKPNALSASTASNRLAGFDSP